MIVKKVSENYVFEISNELEQAGLSDCDVLAVELKDGRVILTSI